MPNVPREPTYSKIIIKYDLVHLQFCWSVSVLIIDGIFPEIRYTDMEVHHLGLTVTFFVNLKMYFEPFIQEEKQQQPK